MAEPLDRDTMIHLLNRLGSEDDADVLEAARHLHGRVVEAGMTWDDLLATDAGSVAPPAAESDVRPVAGPGTGGAGSDADPLALIETLLARSDISTDLRDELAGYRSDIAAGDFSDDDRRYLAALYDRLT